MKNNRGIFLVSFFFNLGVKSGLPRYVAFLGLVQTGILFIPESTWIWLGVDALQCMRNFPVFVQYYVNASSFKNAMFVFWLLSPITLSISTILWFAHVNFQSYPAYLKRRAVRLKQQNKSSDYSLIAGIFIFLVIYIWGTFFYLNEPILLGSFVPAKNRFVMTIVHAGAIALFFPAALTMLITELRANLAEFKIFRN